MAGRNNRAVIRGDLCLLHDELDLVCFVLAGIVFYDFFKRLVVAADDLLAGSFPARIIIKDAESSHVDAHIGRGLVRAFAEDPFKDRAQHRIDLNVTVVVDGSLSVSFQMERIDHVYVV